MKLLFQDKLTELWSGDSTKYTNIGANFVLTNPYAVIPHHLRSCPMLVCDFVEREALAEQRCGSKLELVSKWHLGKAAIWVGNAPNMKVDLSDLVSEGIFFPEALPARLLAAYIKIFPKMVVWDGFMGRGTVGRVCRRRNIPFIGIEKDGLLANQAYQYVLGE